MPTPTPNQPNVNYIQEKANQGLKLLSHDGILIFRKFKALIVDLFLRDHFDVQKHLFDFTGDTDLPAASVKITKINRVRNGVFSLNALYNVTLNDGSELEGHLAEEKVYSYFYIHEPLYGAARNELCIALDFALGASGCEAVVEGFYSVVKIQKHAGGQSNDVLMERSVVDWVLPHPIPSPEIVEAIAKIYIKGDEKKGLKSHRQTKFFDPAGRAARKYETSKVVDRLRREKTLFIDFIL